MKVRWTRAAAIDLAEIASFIAADNPAAAESTTKKIRKATERLAKFPESGRPVPELDDNRVREILVGHYRIVHQVTSKEVQVFCVFEGHRPIPSRIAATRNDK